MSNIKVSSDIDTLLRKSTKQEVATFLGVDTNAANIATNSTNIATKAPLDSPNFTGDVEFKASTYSDPNPPNALTVGENGYVGVNTSNPSHNFEVVGELRTTGSNGQITTGDLTVNDTLYINTLLGGDILCGDLDVSGETTFNDDVTFKYNAELIGDVDITGELDVGQVISCPQIDANTANIGGAEFTGSDVLFEYSVEIGGNFKLSADHGGGSFTKENCYNKDGAVRLQKGLTDSEEVLLRYEGPTSDNFVIQQWHGGNQEGQIKFLGDTPEGSNTIRLDAKNVDIGKAGTVLTKIFSDTNIVSNKKLVFTDTRTKDHGLQFNHSGTGATVQMGMYGSHGDADKGEFKLTHTDSSGDTNVLVVDAENDYTLLSSPKVGINTTGAPTAALDVNGTIKGTDLNINSKGFFVKAGTNGDYLQAKDYGHGDFHDLSDSTNQPKSIPAFGSGGKLVEKTLIKTFKLQGTGFTGLATPVVLVTGVANKYIVPIEMSVYCDYGTRTGTFGNGQGGQSAIQIGTFQNEDNTPSGGGFAQLLAVPVSTANTQGKWLTRKSAPAGNELKQFANRDLVLKSNNVPSSEANAPDGTWYIQLEYMILDEYESFENNVDSTIGTAF